MSSSVRRHKRENKQQYGYGHGLDVLSGDDVVYGDDSDVSLFSNILAEATKGVGGMVAKSQADSAAKAKSKEYDDAAKVAADVRKQASLAAADALAETDQNGPMHKKAASLDMAAKVAEAKAEVLRGGGAPVDAGKSGKGAKAAASSGMPSWVLPAGIGVGVIGAGLLIYKLVSRRK
jgi:hypothetical protein